ncbi:MAG: bifunctional heptose 7-phosphate kinase/heptose 1-phosphate adenyltransferase [Deltaproteobacteria bacterium]|jgi:D-beta-D-heptose 7-phosphate kinase / D-beta-D-heptose 1-phosphate adenosyltransferase|nr:bifunctional heptose 7-phosphate kinase/heptose 1-phosphate adenyltransferase [Deltaproteobacteria bacterium]MBT4088843.1 bifunctional heptose 7-phosphate kinase/heptose 1-phosphate adenyltransferase [Deltaproteobacteria bacterium]MBT4265753.1 bifunctional heptose 7-phosphate kinase/heptose 1-phosphate adenyltransferase [Deltaproteobacteria bacterium]MBT4640286.1 bifunctional heptose 7-phosphate kinase/heptose 1-phosphate adenyltransferase [Deltaproteobacteria bacterium]MBT6615245.1 bifuncti
MNQNLRQQLIQTIQSFTPQKIMVIGDLMLDQYIWGKVDRISPEAPIPIIRMEEEEFRLGGAANVIANIKALDCQVYPVGVIGKGVAGQRIETIFRESDIPLDGIIISSSFRTIVKQRILTRQQQLLRVDYESDQPDFNQFEDQILEKLSKLIPQMDGIILSDYAKGVLSSRVIDITIREAKKKGIPVVCDPGKGFDFNKYTGVTAIKPNRSEAAQLTNLDLKDKPSILKAAAILLDQCQADFLTISLDKDGILLYSNANEYQFIATDAREVFDVTGAGDVVISIIGVLLANKVRPSMAVHLANIAAELEISHLGVVSIPWNEMLNHLSNDGLNRKIMTQEQASTEIMNRHEAPLIFTNGYFDNISAGHLRFLMEIGKIHGRLLVAINSDHSIVQQKGSAPLLKEQDRARLLASLENIYRVIIFDDPDASKVIKALSPDIVVKGEHFRNRLLPEQGAIEEVGAKIEYIQHFSW